MTLRAQVRDETATFLRETGISTLVVTHDPEEAMTLGDRLLVMRDGRILQEGTPEDIYLTPADPFVAGLFGPLNEWTETVSDGQVMTPLGTVTAPGLADGCDALVLIRPEGIRLEAPRDEETATHAVVVESRLLGGLSAVTVVTDAGGWQLRALVAGVYLPAPGSRVAVSIDAARAFVFPAA